METDYLYNFKNLKSICNSLTFRQYTLFNIKIIHIVLIMSQRLHNQPFSYLQHKKC